MTIQFVWGALSIASTVAGLFFLRYWKLTRERLFLYFWLGFWVLAVQWVLLAWVNPTNETRHYFFLLRFLAFLLIIVGILAKNRRGSAR